MIDPRDPRVADMLVQAFNLQRSATALSLHPFDNNLIRELLICRQADLLWNPGRGETDAYDREGRAYELKSTDVRSYAIPSWPTSREVTRHVIAAFRSMECFLFAVFRGIDLLALYRQTAVGLEPFFRELERRLAARERDAKNLNNPKFPWRIVREGADVLFLDPAFSEPEVR